jgi:hypothetical protein
MMCVAPERFYYYYVVVEVDDAKICYIFVCFYHSVSQPVCRDTQMCRQIFQGVLQNRKMSKKYVKLAIFSSFWSLFYTLVFRQTCFQNESDATSKRLRTTLLPRYFVSSFVSEKIQ